MRHPRRYQLAGCIINDGQDRILLLHRNTEDWQHWEVPGGKVETGETIEQTAVREVKEELGVDVRIIKLLAQAEFPEKDYRLHYSWFQAQAVTGQPTVQERQVFDDLRYFSVDELSRGMVPLS